MQGKTQERIGKVLTAIFMLLIFMKVSSPITPVFLGIGVVLVMSAKILLAVYESSKNKKIDFNNGVTIVASLIVIIFQARYF